MNIIVRKKSVYISSAYVLFVEVVHCDLRVILEDHTCNNFVSNIQSLSSAVNFNVFTHLNDLTCSLVSEYYRDKAEWVSLEFVSVCSTNTTSFNFNKNISVANFRHRELFNIKMLKCCKHSYMSCLWNFISCCFHHWSCFRNFLFQHALKYLFYNSFYISRIHIHCLYLRYLIHKLSVITQRLLFVKLLALVRPSPVLLAIVNVQKPSPPNPSAA